jgi:hypothetical protein
MWGKGWSAFELSQDWRNAAISGVIDFFAVSYVTIFLLTAYWERPSTIGFGRKFGGDSPVRALRNLEMQPSRGILETARPDQRGRELEVGVGRIDRGVGAIYTIPVKNVA